MSQGSALGRPQGKHVGSFEAMPGDSGVELEDLVGTLERFTGERIQTPFRGSFRHAIQSRPVYANDLRGNSLGECDLLFDLYTHE